MNLPSLPYNGISLAASQFFRSGIEIPRWLALSSEPLPSVAIGSDTFGVNVAPGNTELIDDYILERLQELGIRHVRMDLSYDSLDEGAGRLLERLLARDVDVLLNLFPAREAAKVMQDEGSAQQEWREFLTTAFTRFGDRIAHFEIGNTPNRGRWSGFSSRGFVTAWRIAAQEAQRHNVALAGPNVSDFEPLFNATYLGVFQTLAVSPQLHTTNLFVERVIEPEAHDHRVFGRAMQSLARLNLIKKARVLSLIGQQRGTGELISSYTCWTAKRLARRSAWPDTKQVDYLLRYLVLGLSSGALKRIYWGPLICHRDGLIDDGGTHYPEVDQVSFYRRVLGDLDDFRINPVFHGLTHAVVQLSNSQLDALYHDPRGLSLFRLSRESESPRYLAWCRDTQNLPLDCLFNATDLESATFHSGQGHTLPRQVSVTEHPLFIQFAQPVAPPEEQRLSAFPIQRTRHFSNAEWQTAHWQNSDWRGGLLLRADRPFEDQALAAQLTPEKLLDAPELRVMRDVRNRLWAIADPTGRHQELAVKLNRVKGIKRFTYRFRPSKGRRHWNNACAMLRRGILTPTPVAWFEHHQKPGVRPSWYVCEFIPEAFSARDVYAALRDGQTTYRGLDKPQWLALIAGFVCTMHNKQIVHRDLSAGNLMLKEQVDGSISPLMIDIGRARVWDGPGSVLKPRHRLQDLIRIAYKLNWQDRAAFIAHYEQALGRSLPGYWRLPFHYYDNKQAFKKSLKGRRKQRKRSTGR